MKKSIAFICLFLVIICSNVSFAQTKVDASEITSAVPELSAFHEIIFPMWHDAYPSKDYNALKGFVPGIKSSVESVNKAKLPGILREKQGAWTSQLNELNKSAQNYYAAAGGNDNNALLSAAENLHSSYEKMVRVIRPSLKEIDDFHQTLYVIYHKLLPDSKYDEISGLTGELITKAEAIVKYPHEKLNPRLGENISKYDALAKNLYNVTLSLRGVLRGNDTNKKKEGVESMHKAYVDLDSLFK